MAADRMLLNPMAKALQSKIFDLFDPSDLSAARLSISCPVDDPFTVHVCADTFYQFVLRRLFDSGFSYFICFDDRFGLTAVLYVSTDLC